MVLIWKMGTGLVIFFCNLSQNTCFVYIFWIGLSLERGVYVMARRRKWIDREHGKKKSSGESEQTAVHAVCFKEQIGHFQQLLDVFGISSNLGGGFWNLP